MCEFIGMETNRCQRLDCAITKLVMDAETKLEQVKQDWAKADQEHYARINAKVAEISQLKAELAEVKDWLKEARAGWSGSDSEFTEAYGELAEMLDVEFTEEKDIEITFKMTARVKVPVGYDLVNYDFDIKRQPVIDGATDEIELLSNEEIYIDDLDINS